jgi:hypothetical protein
LNKGYLQTFVEDYIVFLRSSSMHFPGDGTIDAKIREAEAFMDQSSTGTVQNQGDTLRSLSDYLATLKKVSDSNKSLESRIRNVSNLLKHPAAMKNEESDELCSYIDARESSIRRAGISEKRVFSSLANGQRKFLDEPVVEYCRPIDKEELREIMDRCFGKSKRSNIGQAGTQALLYGMLGMSEFKPLLPMSLFANSVVWGVAAGSRSLAENYCTTISTRSMTTALVHIFGNAFRKQGIAVEAAFCEHDSALLRAYHTGYAISVAGSLPLAYVSDWPLYIPIAASAAVAGFAYRSWFKAVRNLKEEIVNYAK